MSRQARCRICRKRPPWRYKNCPPGICKKCYHARIWPDRLAARRERRATQRAAAADPLADDAGRLVYDDDLGTLYAADPRSLDPLDLEAVGAWEEEYGARWDPDSEEEQTTSLAPAARPPRKPARQHPRCRLCRRVRHRYAESADGLLRVCLECAQGVPLAQRTAREAAAELIARRRRAHRHDFIERLCSRFPELPWDSGMVRDGRQRRESGPAGPQRQQPQERA